MYRRPQALHHEGRRRRSGCAVHRLAAARLAERSRGASSAWSRTSPSTCALEEAEHAREAAEASNRAKSEFLSRMSHELRTPLNAMLGFAPAARARPAPSAAPRRSGPGSVQIQQAGWHLLEMINDVLDLSRIESGNLRLQTDTLDLADAASRRRWRWSRATAQARGISISQELAPARGADSATRRASSRSSPTCSANAVKYNREGGRVHVASRIGAAGVVEIAVTDTGLGMTPRADGRAVPAVQPARPRAQRAHEGTGIGLVISQRLAELMGGALEARSVAGEGSSFILTLPRAIDAATPPPDALDELEPHGAEYHRRRRPLHRGQRDQRRGDARHPGAAPAGAAARLDRPASTRWRRSAPRGPT